MDFEFIREQTPLYVEAAKLTLSFSASCFIFSSFDLTATAKEDPDCAILEQTCDTKISVSEPPAAIAFDVFSMMENFQPKNDRDICSSCESRGS